MSESREAAASASSASTADTADRVTALASEVGELKTFFKSQFAALTAWLAPATRPDGDTAGNPIPAPLHSHFTPPSTAAPGLLISARVEPAAVERTLDARDFFQRQGSLGFYERSRHQPDFPSRRFIPVQEGLYRRINDMDRRDGHEAHTLWNQGYNQETALAAFLIMQDAMDSGDFGSAKEDMAVHGHYLQASYHRGCERRDFFMECLEYGKHQATTRANTYRDSSHPYSSPQSQNTDEEMARLRAAAYAKETVRREVAGNAPPQPKNGKPGGQSK